MDARALNAPVDLIVSYNELLCSGTTPCRRCSSASSRYTLPKNISEQKQK
jgi:hypothetical protein